MQLGGMNVQCLLLQHCCTNCLMELQERGRVHAEQAPCVGLGLVTMSKELWPVVAAGNVCFRFYLVGCFNAVKQTQIVDGVRIPLVGGPYAWGGR